MRPGRQYGLDCLTPPVPHRTSVVPSLDKGTPAKAGAAKPRILALLRRTGQGTRRRTPPPPSCRWYRSALPFLAPAESPPSHAQVPWWCYDAPARRHGGSAQESAPDVVLASSGGFDALQLHGRAYHRSSRRNSGRCWRAGADLNRSSRAPSRNQRSARQSVGACGYAWPDPPAMSPAESYERHARGPRPAGGLPPPSCIAAFA
jgi:hypothetical protein